MIRLTRSPDLMLGQHWANLLEQAGIACHLSGRYLQGAAGDIPVDQCGPDLWIENERDRDLAMRIIDGRAGGPAGRRTPGTPGARGSTAAAVGTAGTRPGSRTGTPVG